MTRATRSAGLGPAVRNVWDRAGMILVFAVLFAVLSLTVRNFCTWSNLVSLLLQVSTVGMVACTMLFCLASGDFDLSVEAVIAFSGVFAAIVMAKTGSVALGIACGVLGGAVVGLINGIIIAEFRINALIATLATWQIVKGLAFIVSDGKAVSIPQEDFFLLAKTPVELITRFTGTLPAWLAWADGPHSLLRVPNPVWMMLGAFAIFGFLLNRTTFGRNTLAIGGNREAARLAGIHVNRTKILIFTLQGLVTGFAGVVVASKFTSGQPNTAVGFSLDVISACVLGGVALSGGMGTMAGTIVGVLIMGSVQNAMDLLGISAFYQYVARGVILLAAVLLDQLKNSRPSGARPLVLEVATLAAMLILPVLLILGLAQVPDAPCTLIVVLVHLAALLAVLSLRSGSKLSWFLLQPYLLLEIVLRLWTAGAFLTRALRMRAEGVRVTVWGWGVGFAVLFCLLAGLLGWLWVYLYRPAVRRFCQVGVK